MDDSLFDEDRPLERYSLVPGQRFFVPADLREAQEIEETQSAVADADIVVVTDADADGLACAAMIRTAHGDAGLVPSGPHDLADDLERVLEYGDPETVYICDICPDTIEEIQSTLVAFTDQDIDVRWYDHHQWEDTIAKAVRAIGVDLVVGDSEEECSADVTLRSLPEGLPERFAELAAVTRDHDLWIKDDERSDDLADYAYWAEDPETYVETVREHGVSLPPDVRDLLEERRVRKHALIDRAVDRATLRTIGPWTVGITYGRCSANEVAEELRSAHGADASVIVKPAGAASIRGSADFERCHEVARQVNGGGHPRAAGCKPDIYADILDYAHHWVTEGAVAKQTIITAFERVAAQLQAEEDTDVA